MSNSPELIVAKVHSVPDAWLTARVRPWLERIESPGLDFWIGTFTSEGKWIYASNGWAAPSMKQVYAQEVCRYVNLHCGHGGAWLAGWIRGGAVFYLLWVDADGDIQIPIDCERSFAYLLSFIDPRTGEPAAWGAHCDAAWGVWDEIRRNMELTDAQQKKVAQGEQVSREHFTEAPKLLLS